MTEGGNTYEIIHQQEGDFVTPDCVRKELARS